ncbi:hypothetical protein AUC69_02395 [Methyloceanibacter superfactus]|uniref:Uncharacterized protein n=1 Tax=Methyloceanibacter superfactus TaxID=1774969 RepID=A0A1E3VPG3_9HYPH|nr:hypothetical protein [Methyloceanibacter superfactus]ODR95382.1 hypothetical protein AUC69_02395 [Methyloceanibacter superfactus]
MPDRDEDTWGGIDGPFRRDRKGFVASALSCAARALETESDRWFLWLPVLFATGILTYFALYNEPGPRIAATLVLGAAACG